MKKPRPASSPVAATLNARQSTHGSFSDNASIAQRLKQVMRSGPNWHTLPHEQAEALDMIASKIGRILSGDAEFLDHVLDIEGYAHLACIAIKGRSKALS